MKDIHPGQDKWIQNLHQLLDKFFRCASYGFLLKSYGHVAQLLFSQLAELSRTVIFPSSVLNMIMGKVRKQNAFSNEAKSCKPD